MCFDTVPVLDCVDEASLVISEKNSLAFLSAVEVVAVVPGLTVVLTGPMQWRFQEEREGLDCRCDSNLYARASKNEFTCF
jgi:hypothetical protein